MRAELHELAGMIALSTCIGAASVFVGIAGGLPELVYVGVLVVVAPPVALGSCWRELRGRRP